MKKLLSLLFLIASPVAFAHFDEDIAAIEKNLIDWRRHLHQNPELSNHPQQPS